MKQEKILSIRLSPDGLSFWTTGLSAKATGSTGRHTDLWSRTPERNLASTPDSSLTDNIAAAFREIMAAQDAVVSMEIYPDTLANCIIPAEYFDQESAAGYLAINNIQIKPGDAVFNAPLDADTVSLIVFDNEAVHSLGGLFAGQYSIKSPFSVNDTHIEKYGAGKRRRACVYLSPGNAYITVYEGKSGSRLFMETFRWATAADILYYISLLDKEFHLGKSKIYLRGARCEEVYGLLRKYFRKSRCE